MVDIVDLKKTREDRENVTHNEIVEYLENLIEVFKSGEIDNAQFLYCVVSLEDDSILSSQLMSDYDIFKLIGIVEFHMSIWKDMLKDRADLEVME